MGKCPPKCEGKGGYWDQALIRMNAVNSKISIILLDFMIKTNFSRFFSEAESLGLILTIKNTQLIS